MNAVGVKYKYGGIEGMVMAGQIPALFLFLTEAIPLCINKFV